MQYVEWKLVNHVKMILFKHLLQILFFFPLLILLCVTGKRNLPLVHITSSAISSFNKNSAAKWLTSSVCWDSKCLFKLCACQFWSPWEELTMSWCYNILVNVTPQVFTMYFLKNPVSNKTKKECPVLLRKDSPFECHFSFQLFPNLYL